MSALSTFWIGLLLATPLLSVVYVMSVYVVVRRYLPIDFHRYAPWLNSGFVTLVGATAFVVTPYEIPLQARWVYFATLPAGIALYSFDSYLKTRFAGQTLNDGTESVVTMFPVLVVPLFEEVIFRAGYVFLDNRFGTAVFVVGSAAAFGVHHVGHGPTEALFKFGNGLVYAVLFVLTGSIVPPLLAHTGYNLAAMVVIADTPFSAELVVPFRR